MTARLLALAVAAALAAPAAAQPPAGADLVPTNAFGFVTVKVSDLWDAEQLKGAREVLTKGELNLAAEMEKATGVAPADVERVTLFWPTAGGVVADAPFIAVTTRKPYNEAKLLKSLGAVPASQMPWLRNRLERGHPVPTGKAADHFEKKDPPPPPPVIKDDPCAAEAEAADDAGELFVLPRGGAYPAVYLLDDRTLLFLPMGDRGDGGVNFVALVGQLLRKKADGPLADALTLAGAHTIVIAARVAQLEPVLAAVGEVPKEVVPFRSLLKARVATLAADVGATAKVTVRFSFADDAAARRAAPVLQTLAQSTEEGLAAVRKEAEKDEYLSGILLPLIDAAKTALGKVEAKADGTAVVATAEVEAGPALAKALAGAPQAIQASADRMKTQNNLKQIGLAIHNFHDTMGHMPTDVLDANGKAILSWRVQILPYIEQDNLYKQLDLTKPWDDPRNKKVLEQMPNVFRVYGRDTKGKGLTYLQMPSAEKRVEGGDPIKVAGRKLRITDMHDGSSNSFMVVEATDPVLWMKPDDVTFDPKALPKLGAPGRGRFQALFGDGSVREFKRAKLMDEQLRALFTINGGEVVSYDDR